MRENTGESWETALARWESFLLAQGLRAATISTRLNILKRLAHMLGDTPDKATINAYVTYIKGKKLTGDSRRLYAISVKLFYEWYNTNYKKAVETVTIPIPRKIKGRPRPASIEDIKTALANCGERESLIILLAAELGLRRGEIAQLHSRDVLDGLLLRVQGKGGRTRVIPISPHLYNLLKTRGPGWIFPSRRGGGVAHLVPSTISDMVRGYLPPGVRLHDLRHSFATRVYNGGADLLSVQQFLGHCSPETTLNYILTADEKLRECVNLGKIV